MNKFFYILAFVLLVSCTSNTIYKKPKNLISKDTMVNLLFDMFIASSSSNFKNKQLKRQINYMPLVYEKYKIDSTRFTISNVYYTSEIEEYEKMLKEVKARLKQQQKTYVDQLKAIDSVEKEKKGKDIEYNEKLFKKEGKLPETLFLKEELLREIDYK